MCRSSGCPRRESSTSRARSTTTSPVGPGPHGSPGGRRANRADSSARVRVTRRRLPSSPPAPCRDPPAATSAPPGGGRGRCRPRGARPAMPPGGAPGPGLQQDPSQTPGANRTAARAWASTGARSCGALGGAGDLAVARGRRRVGARRRGGPCRCGRAGGCGLLRRGPPRRGRSRGSPRRNRLRRSLLRRGLPRRSRLRRLRRRGLPRGGLPRRSRLCRTAPRCRLPGCSPGSGRLDAGLPRRPRGCAPARRNRLAGRAPTGRSRLSRRSRLSWRNRRGGGWPVPRRRRHSRPRRRSRRRPCRGPAGRGLAGCRLCRRGLLRGRLDRRRRGCSGLPHRGLLGPAGTGRGPGLGALRGGRTDGRLGGLDIREQRARHRHRLGRDTRRRGRGGPCLAPHGRGRLLGAGGAQLVATGTGRLLGTTTRLRPCGGLLRRRGCPSPPARSRRRDIRCLLGDRGPALRPAVPAPGSACVAAAVASRRRLTSARNRATSSRAPSRSAAGTRPSRETATSTSPRTRAVRFSRLAKAAARISSASAPTCPATLPVVPAMLGNASNPCAASSARARVSSPRPEASWT